MTGLCLYGYRYSVYTRIARWALAEKALTYDYVEVNPFDTQTSPESVNVFGQVPVLVHDDFKLYETVAITRYVDESGVGISLQPAEPRSIGRMVQIQSMIDQQGYQPIVRQLFAHRVFRPFEGEVADEDVVRRGIEGSRRFLDALSSIMLPTTFLCGSTLTLADIHLGPMIDYLQMSPEGLTLLNEQPALLTWWRNVQSRECFVATRQWAGGGVAVPRSSI